MRGHIRLGNDINDLRDYLLVNDAKIRQRILANPMAAKLGQGAGKYDDLTNWSGWVMENWQAGLGKREADAEGFLYAELETRFQGQLTLPLLYTSDVTGFPSGGGVAPNGNPFPVFDEILTVSTTGTYQKLAYQTGCVNYTNYLSVMFFGNPGGTVTAKIYADTGGNPDAGTLLASATAGYGTPLTFNWDYFAISTANLASTTVWVVLETTGSFQIPVQYASASDGLGFWKYYNGSAWVNKAILFPFTFVCNTSASYKNGAISSCIYASLPHFITSTSQSTNALWKYSSSQVSRATALSAAPVAMQAFGDVLYICYDGSRGVDGWNGTAITNQAGVFASLFASWNGYLWRAYQNDVYYTANGTTWTGPIQIGPDGYNVTGLAGLGEDMYATTDEGLYKIGAGDLVSGIMRWNSINAANGKKMINHQGALYIPTYGDLLRFGGAEVMSITPMKDEGMPAYKQGRVVALASHNYWLFAVVAGTQSGYDGWAEVIAYNDQGWHYIGKLNRGDISTTLSSSITWDTVNNYLWVCGQDLLYRFWLPTTHQNPYKDNSGSAQFFPGGSLETPWFYSGLKEIRKDCESIYISGENIDSTKPVLIYWKDDDSTDWEYLGTVTSNRQELRWSDPDTRPNTRQIKLGIVMFGLVGGTPRIDAIRLKFQNMVTDRWRWQLSINVGDNQEMLDSDLNIYTKEQQRAHLDTLIRGVGPILFEDVDGVQYEVKVLGASEQVERYEYLENAPNFTSVYSLTVEQATTTSYN